MTEIIKENNIQKMMYLPVEIENIDDIQKLLDKADKQFSELSKTFGQIKNCQLNVSLKIIQ